MCRVRASCTTAPRAVGCCSESKFRYCISSVIKPIYWFHALFTHSASSYKHCTKASISTCPKANIVFNWRFRYPGGNISIKVQRSLSLFPCCCFFLSLLFGAVLIFFMLIALRFSELKDWLGWCCARRRCSRSCGWNYRCVYCHSTC